MTSSAQRGIQWLLTTQRADGDWNETAFTGTGFPKVFYLRYHYYRISFPLIAIARWHSSVGFESNGQKTHVCRVTRKSVRDVRRSIVMSVPVGQMMAVLRHVAVQRLRGNDKYPLVLMLEPLFRCNLACAGCGKIQHPSEILRQHLSPSQCLKAVDECGAPIVAIPGGEPLLHPQIGEIIEGIVARKKYLYVCTNAIKLEEMLPRFKPSKYLAFSIHLDGLKKEHDASVCRNGVYEMAINAIRAAKKAGFRVTTNSTLFADAEPERCSQFFDEVMQLGVEGMMVSPGYSYEKAPEQDIFLSRERSHGLFRKIFKSGGGRWKFNQSPVFLEFLKGNWDLECRPWGDSLIQPLWLAKTVLFT